MALTPFENQLKKIAFFLGAIQGLAYGLMALICIILYNKDPINPTIYGSYMDLVQENMYGFILNPSDASLFDYTLHPKTFTGFAWVYFILHLGWIGVSVEASRKKGVTSPKYLTAWSHLTLLISVWDFITVVILGSDYNKCMNFASTVASYNPYLSEISVQGACSTGILTVLVIAARGFVLWIVNVIFAVLLHKMAKQLKTGGQVLPQRIAAPAPAPAQAPAQAPLGFQLQHPPTRPSGFTPQSPRPASYIPSTPQNVNKNQFDYPVAIPDPDYYYNQHQSSPPRRF